MSKELLSAAVDDAATAQDWDRLLDAMQRDPTLKDDWSRICQARDARESVAVGRAGNAFCAGVMAALETPSLASRVVDLGLARDARRPAQPPTRAPVRLSWRSLVPLSAAAGIAAAVLLLGRPLTDKLAPAGIQTVAVKASEEPMPEVDPASASGLALNDYLIEHSNTLADRDMGGSLAGARFAIRTASYSADGQ